MQLGPGVPTCVHPGCTQCCQWVLEEGTEQRTCANAECCPSPPLDLVMGPFGRGHTVSQQTGARQSARAPGSC